MQALTKLMIASALSLLLSPLVHAQAPIGTLTCQPGSGTALTASTYSFEFDYSGNVGGSATLMVDPTLIPTLVPVSSPISYPQCVLSNGGSTITLSNVTLDPGALAVGYAPGILTYGPSLYTSVELSFTTLASAGLPSGYSHPPVGSLNCVPPSGPDFNASILFFDISGPTGLDLDVAALPSALAAAQAGTTYTCTLASGGASITLSGATISDAGVIGAGAGVLSSTTQLYATVNFAYTTENASGTADYAGISSIGNLSCVSSLGTTLTTPVYVFGVNPGGGEFASMVVSFSQFSTINAAAAAATIYPTCTLTSTGAPVTLTNASFEVPDVAGYVGPTATVPQLYTESTLAYESIFVNGETVPPSVARNALTSAQPKRSQTTLLRFHPLASRRTASARSPLTLK